MESMKPHFQSSRFNESLSCGSCNDKRDEVTTLNVPALSAYYKVIFEKKLIFHFISFESYYTLILAFCILEIHVLTFLTPFIYVDIQFRCPKTTHLLCKLNSRSHTPHCTEMVLVCGEIEFCKSFKVSGSLHWV